MKKMYKCRRSRCGILVNYKGETVHVDLENDVINEYGLRGSSFTTEDVEMQKAIESHPFFGVNGLDRIWTDDVEEVHVEEQTEIKKSRRTKSK